MYARNLLQSFRYAFRGLGYSLKTQRNMRIHLYLAILVILTGLILRLPPIEIAVLCCVISFVFIAEIVNTAVESNMDFLSKKQFHPAVKMIKDIFAGVVLVAAINAAIVGYIIFTPHFTLYDNVIEAPKAIEFRKPKTIDYEGRTLLCLKTEGTVPNLERHV
ncbi:diacylglycerol kinase family protein [Candidatus Omnitrophota bacterium]